MSTGDGTARMRSFRETTVFSRVFFLSSSPHPPSPSVLLQLQYSPAFSSLSNGDINKLKSGTKMKRENTLAETYF